MTVCSYGTFQSLQKLRSLLAVMPDPKAKGKDLTDRLAELTFTQVMGEEALEELLGGLAE